MLAFFVVYASSDTPQQNKAAPGTLMKKFLLLVCASALFSSTVNATPITFFGEDISGTSEGSNENHVIENLVNSDAARDQFASYFDSSVYFETFESFQNATALTGWASYTSASESPGNIEVDFDGAGKATLSGQKMGLVSTNPDDGATIPGWSGTYATSGHQYLGVSTGRTEATFGLTFEEAQSAFGFYATDFEMAPLTLTFTYANGETKEMGVDYSRATSAIDRTNNGSAFFFGVIDLDASFTAVTFKTESSWEGFGFDDFVIAKASQLEPPVVTPEPGMISLFGLGLFGIVAYQWKRRK